MTAAKRQSILRLFVLGCVFALPLCHPALPAQAQGAASRYENQVKPALSVPIPDLTFSDITVTQVGGEDGTTITRTLDVPFLADYIASIYKYALGTAGVLATVLMMIGGFEYVIGRPKEGMSRIKNAVIGMALTAGCFVILQTVNPALVDLGGLKVGVVQPIDFDPNEDSGDIIDSSDEAAPRTGTGSYPLIKQKDFKEYVYTRCPGDSSLLTPMLVADVKAGNIACTCGTGAKAPDIWDSGCGPVSLTMALQGLGKDASVPRVAKQVIDNDGRICGSGSAPAVLAKVAESYGLTGEGLYDNKTGSRRDKIIACLAKGPVIVTVNKKSMFTNGGHFILLTGTDGNGGFYVNDPAKSQYDVYYDEAAGTLYKISGETIYLMPTCTADKTTKKTTCSCPGGSTGGKIKTRDVCIFPSQPSGTVRYTLPIGSPIPEKLLLPYIGSAVSVRSKGTSCL